MKKMNKTAVTVVCIVAFVVALGLGIMMSGERGDMKTFTVKSPDTTMVVDTVPVDSIP